MHELGVVFYVIDAVKKVAEEHQVSHISSVTIELGEVSTVIPHLLEDVWQWAIKKHEILTDSALKIERIEAITHCENCGHNYPTVQYAKICPECGSDHTYLLQGNEFTIKDIEVY